MRDSTISEVFALELMREGKLLMRMHTVNGLRWFVVPGGQIADSTLNESYRVPTCNRTTAGCSQDVSRLSGSAGIGMRPADNERPRGRNSPPPLARTFIGGITMQQNEE
jgi:hypothetical protein